MGAAAICAVMCMGVMAGAYILTLFAMKFRERVLGLILVSPLCKAPSWTEWLCNKVMSNLLYYYGMCSLLKDCLLYRYFSKEVRGSAEVPESDIVQACRKLLDDRQSTNVLRFFQAINRRLDITDGLRTLKCRTLIFVGDDSSFHSEALHMAVNLDRRYSALVEVQACGSVVTEEQPYTMLVSAHGIFSPGVWYTQTESFQWQPKESTLPNMYSARTPLSGKHGIKAKTNQDTHLVTKIALDSLPLVN